MKYSPKQIVIILGGFIVIGILLFVLFGGGSKPKPPPPVTLSIWTVLENEDVSSEELESIFQKYREVKPNVTIEHRALPKASYKATLLNALAAGEGPDVFMIGNRSLPKEIDKLAPLNPLLPPAPQFGIANLRELFPTVVEQDFRAQGSIYALPLDLDTLALFYNRDLFDQVGIVAPPVTWDEFQELIPKLRILTPQKQITRGGAALGATERTVPHAADLVSLLMMQNGTEMNDPGTRRAAFASGESGERGLQAFDFYLQFGNAASPFYTWNESEPSAFDAFAAQEVTMIFGYKSDMRTIRAKAPFLNFGVAPIPQAKGAQAAVSYPRYWGLAVSKQSKHPAWAWNFIVNFTTNQSYEKMYMKATGNPPALRSLVKDAMNAEELSVFAKQALTARSWYQADPERTKDIFNEAIRSVLAGETDSATALSRAEGQVNQLMRSGQ